MSAYFSGENLEPNQMETYIKNYKKIQTVKIKVFVQLQSPLIQVPQEHTYERETKLL